MHRTRYQLIVFFLSIFLTTSAWADADWKITLKVSDSSTYGYCVAGVKESGATDGYDKLWDTRAMLGTLNTIYIYSYFPHPEWNEQVINYSQDIKAAGPHKEWLFEVDSNSNSQLTVEWPDLAAKIADFGATLVDLDGSGEEIDMQMESSFTFQNMPGTKRQFMLIVDEPEVPEPDTLWFELKDNKVALHWTKSDDPSAEGYRMYRKINDGMYGKRQRFPVTQDFYLDKISKKLLRSPETVTIRYKIVTFDSIGNEIFTSNEVVVLLDAEEKERVLQSGFPRRKKRN
jgi:hypothetical protein